MLEWNGPNTKYRLTEKGQEWGGFLSLRADGFPHLSPWGEGGAKSVQLSAPKDREGVVRLSTVREGHAHMR